MKPSKLVTIATIILGLLLVIYIVMSSLNKSNNLGSTDMTTPTVELSRNGENNIHTDYPPAYLTQAAQDAFKGDPNIKRNEKVAVLNSHLPVEQPLFKLHYDYEISQFVLTLQRDKELEGSDAFIRFIQQYGVESDSWLSLKTVVE